MARWYIQALERERDALKTAQQEPVDLVGKLSGAWMRNIDGLAMRAERVTRSRLVSGNRIIVIVKDS
jgi:hypothetical protein